MKADNVWLGANVVSRDSVSRELIYAAVAFAFGWTPQDPPIQPLGHANEMF